MVTFNFIEYGEYLGTRQLGAKVKEVLWPVIRSNEKTVLDFSGVKVVSNSFADECLAKLLDIYSLEELKMVTTFRGLNEFAHKCVAVAIKRRYKYNSVASEAV